MDVDPIAPSSELAPEQLQYSTIETFLQSVEKRAYRMALLALSNHADAIDVLQDAMLKLVTHYEDRPANEWKPLFYRILQNRIRDFQRQYTLKNMLFFWRKEDQEDLLDDLPAPTDATEPAAVLDKQTMQETVLQMLQQLPEKQRQCFLLRSWEGVSVRDTAAIMGCSEGSVKTHYSRAIAKLRAHLGEEYDVQI